MTHRVYSLHILITSFLDKLFKININLREFVIMFDPVTLIHVWLFADFLSMVHSNKQDIYFMIQILD